MYYTENLRLVDGRIGTDIVAGGCNYKDENFYPLLDAAYEHLIWTNVLLLIKSARII